MTSRTDPDDFRPPTSPTATVHDLIRTERLSLIELLEGLGDQEWVAPSLCEAWTVQDVSAHLAWAPVVGPWEGVAGLCRSGFRMNAYVGRSAVRWSARGRAAILDQLRDNAATGAAPTGMPDTAALTDAIVHGLDIRRPLGRPRPIPPDAFLQVVDWNAGLRWPMTIPVGGSVRRRIGGVRLVAEGLDRSHGDGTVLDWSHGDGPEVRGSADALMLLVTGRGRQVGPTELNGPGAPGLYSRLRGR